MKNKFYELIDDSVYEVNDLYSYKLKLKSEFFKNIDIDLWVKIFRDYVLNFENNIMNEKYNCLSKYRLNKNISKHISCLVDDIKISRIESNEKEEYDEILDILYDVINKLYTEEINRLELIKNKEEEEKKIYDEKINIFTNKFKNENYIICK